MKADFTRSTFKAAKHYRTLRMQQGRVQTDADWNEQQDILNHRIETETVDTVGPNAGPIDNGGFALSAGGKNVTIGAGDYYVDGLLCENPQEVNATTQPDLPTNASPVLPSGASVLPLPPVNAVALSDIQVYDSSGKPVNPADGIYIGYLEVWQRHITALEDGLIREVALGGPDTGTREKTIWQVKFLRAGDLGANLTCLSDAKAWNDLVAPPDGTLAARSEPSTPPKNPCLLAPDAGFRRLENLLYRVEIHDDGTLSGKVRYKWSHDNGSISTKVTRWLGNPVADEFEVASIGRDAYLAIVAGCWVEFYDDTHELLSQPGTLVQVLKTAGNVVTLDLATKTGALDEALFTSNPRVRRWDGWDDIAPAVANSNSGWVALEDGVEIKFTPGHYRIGDYWMIPARTATADVEWPQAGGKPAFQPPQGILRAFARLALLACSGGTWALLSDCRRLFPRLTELTNLFYVGGDGQEAVPNPLDPGPVPLPQPLEVAVYNGQFPVQGAQVRFSVSSGQLGNSSTTQSVTTNADGVAAASWSLASDKPSQGAVAELLEAGQPAPGKYNEIHFSAQLSIAAQVAYDPAKCPGLKAQGINTVQAAVDALCQTAHGGGCCTTVGMGGQFATLDKALRTLIERGSRDICLCLLPGQQHFEDALNLQAPSGVNLTVRGAARASQLLLQGQEFKLIDFASVNLSDFDVQGTDKTVSLNIQGCDDVRLANIHMAGTTVRGASLVTIQDASRIDVSDNTLRGIDPAAVDRAVAILAQADALKPLQASLKTEKFELFRPLDRTVLAQFSKLNAAQRKDATTQIDALLRSTGDPLAQDPAVQTALVQVRTQLAQAGDARKLAAALDGLRNSLVGASPGFALALDAPAAITVVADNIVQGRLSIYGEATTQDVLTTEVLKPLGGALHSGAAHLVAGRGDLRLRNNHLVEIRLGDKLIALLKKIVSANQGAIEDCYRSLIGNDNEFLGANNELLAVDLGLSLNAMQQNGDFGTCIATQTKYLGNFAHNDFRLFNVGNVAEAFGNGGLNLINM
jgi:Family of unknown function (DUF6519)